MKRIISALAAGAIAVLAAAPAHPQLLGGQVGQVVGDAAGGIGSAVGGVVERTPGALGVDRLARPITELARDRLRGLLRANPRMLEADDRGFPVVRGEVIAIAPGEDALARARAAGFQPLRRETMEELGIAVVTLATPPSMDARRALKRLTAIDPAGQYTLNHIYVPAGEGGAGAEAGAAKGTGDPARIGLIDTGVAQHPALAGRVAGQRGFAPGGVVPASHGTAVASLLVGRGAGFRGSAAGERLLVADVYGDGATGGSAGALARALGWMVSERVDVVNISLVGPPNLLVRTAVAATRKAGLLVVAAVGNDGPAAAPLYPASYPGVIAVTGVDARNKVLIEAGRGTHVDFAAPGAAMAAALSRGGYADVRGTSFAAPLVAGRLALLPGDPAARVTALGAEAVDLGAKGPDAVYGRGLVCANCRNMVNKTK